MAIGDKKKVLMEQDIGKVIIPAAIGAYSLIRGTAIPSNADLDTYTEPGSYICQTTATAGSLANSPVTNTGFSLHVEIVSGASSNYLHQTLRVNNATADVWKRRYHPTSGWGEWDRFATMDDLEASPKRPTVYNLPLADGVGTNRPFQYFMTRDGVVSLYGEPKWASADGGLPGDNITIAQLPEGFRPTSIVSVPATWWFNSSSGSAAVRRAGAVIINTNGSIVARIAPGDIVESVQADLFVSATFVAAEIE